MSALAIAIVLPEPLTPAQLQTARHEFESQLDDWLKEHPETEAIRQVVHLRSQWVDAVVQALWQQAGLAAYTGLTLFAVGGYGRGELLPLSDVDLLILSREPLNESTQQQVSQFVGTLWDARLDPGVAVRTIEECREAMQDISVATTLVESRRLAGDPTLDRAPRQLVQTVWSDADFYAAKMLEQSERHTQHHDTEYNLEPDIKNAPGGLRDLHQIGWITKRHFRVNRLYDLVTNGWLSDFEYRNLIDCESFLWRVRHYLHRLSKRNENRLRFDYQRDIAAEFGFIPSEDLPGNEAVEAFMKQYYRVAMQVSTFNELILSYFWESVLEPRLPVDEQPMTQVVNERFVLVGDHLSISSHRVFAEHPSAILEVFYLMASMPHAAGIRARTLRLLLLAARRNIDTSFRQAPQHRALFMAILRAPYRLYETFSAMKRYGVLGQYLPAFGQIIGLMQFDLFHIYTVDTHTLILLRNLRRLSDPAYEQDFPIATTVFQRLDRKEIVYLAAIFHDIAKGRGGDHSELGAKDAEVFCLAHGLSQREANIVVWLTRHHLLMSLTAQKKDISDPDVVQAFALQVGDLVHLDNLYCLTVADINATNPNLWNSWRASLLRQLYQQARHLLRTGVGTPIDRQDWINDTKQQALQLLASGADLDQTRVDELWAALGDDYFLRERPAEVAWHTTEILRHTTPDIPLIGMREHRQLAPDAVQIFVYTQDQPNLFAATVCVFDQEGLNVQDARIITAESGFSLDTYVVLDELGDLLTDLDRRERIVQRLQHALKQPEQVKSSSRMTPSQLRHFDFRPEIRCTPHASNAFNVLEINTLDRPGLLATMGACFCRQKLAIHSARITTLGERAEDVFFITKADRLLTEAEQAELFEDLDKALSLSNPKGIKVVSEA